MKARAQVPAPEAVAPEPEVAVSPAPQPVEASAAEVVETSAPETSPVLEVVQAPEALQAPEVLEAPEPEPAEAAPAVEAPPEAVQEATRAVESGPAIFADAKSAGPAKTAAEEATAAVGASFGAARDGVIAFNVKAIEAIKDEADANLDMLASLAGAKSISQVIALQTEFARQRFEHAATRAKELAELMRKVADETSAPIKAHVAKTFKIAV